MPKYVIEREIPGAGKLSAAELQAISQKSSGVIEEMGSRIQWIHSYVTAGKVYCVYIAADEQMIREHAQTCGTPSKLISEVVALIDPATAK